MVWTYNSALATTRDQVRFLVQDTNTSNKLLDDSEVDWMLTQETNIYFAAAALADALSAKYAGVKSIDVDGLSVDYSGLSDRYAALAARLRRQAQASAGGIGLPFVSGVSVSEMNSINSDTDRVPNKFRINQNQFAPDNPDVER